MENSECLITTFDNPIDPFDDFEKWLRYDRELGHNTCAYLARIAKTSDELSDAENAQEIERAIDEIIKFDPLNIYKKVRRNSIPTTPMRATVA